MDKCRICRNLLIPCTGEEAPASFVSRLYFPVIRTTIKIYINITGSGLFRPAPEKFLDTAMKLVNAVGLIKHKDTLPGYIINSRSFKFADSFL